MSPAPKKNQSIVLTADDASQTLEKFLRKLLPNAALSLVYSLVRKGRVRVDDAKVEKKYRLSEGERVTLELSDADYASLRADAKAKSATRKKREGRGQALDPRCIVYEDKALLIVNKDAGIAVHPGDHKSDEASLIELAQDYLADKKSASLTFKPSLAHRIDRETSGLVVIARTKESLDRMTKYFREGTVKKTYLAVTVGAPEPASGTVDATLERIDSPDGSAKMLVGTPKGQKARTRYKTLRAGIMGRYALIECKPETGRMHQIRVHLASLGCPILADARYGDAGENGHARRAFGISRHLLHAAEISFVHPVKNVPVTYRARLKPDMQKFLDEAEKKEGDGSSSASPDGR